MDWLLALLLGYALGSIPFGLLLAKAAGKGDIRQVGSGNIGATNVLRTGSKGLAAAVLLLDFSKGLVPVIIAGWLSFDEAALAMGAVGLVEMPKSLAALGAVVGHCFPIWLKFKGGKGVATNAGVSFGIAWPIGLVYALVWLGALAVGRISSVAGMSAVIAAPFAAWLLNFEFYVLPLALIALLIVWQHRANIRRLLAGEEPKIGRKG
jgi:acyl phosphate:glycerol-3-phosphate acyltransferase